MVREPSGARLRIQAGRLHKERAERVRLSHHQSQWTCPRDRARRFCVVGIKRDRRIFRVAEAGSWSTAARYAWPGPDREVAFLGERALGSGLCDLCVRARGETL